MDGAQIGISTRGDGDGGNLKVDVSEAVRLIGFDPVDGTISGLFSQTIGKGNAGSVSITTGSLEVTNGAQIGVSTFGEGNAGSVNITATDSVKFDGESKYGLNSGAVSQVEFGAVGKAGDVSITAALLEVTNGAQIGVSTFGEGNAGSVNITATDSVKFDSQGKDGFPSGAFSTVEPLAVGKAGGVSITTGSLGVTNGAEVSASTSGKGDAGNVTIETGSLSVINSQVGSSVFGQGNAGNLTIRAADSVEVSGKIKFGNIENPAGLFAQVNVTGEGRGGNLTVETERLSVSNGGKVQVATFGQGDAGNLTIRASEVEVFDTPVGSSIVTGINAGIEIDPDETVVPPRGNGGDLTIETDRLSVRNGAEVSVSTAGVGNAGRLGIQASESVEVVGTSLNGNFKSQISAEVKPEGTGSGGSLSLKTEQMIVRDGAEVTVSSLGSGEAGNLQVQADSISLDNQGAITAITRTGDGGNITLKVQDLLLLRRGSQISTTAGTSQAGGNGGNITINAPFIIALPQENSDLTANAFEGNGGNIRIDTNGIFGIEFRDQQTPLSDITASSEFGRQGEVEINASAIDPTRGLNNLPQEAVEAEVAQSCQTVGGKSTLEFFALGRGGLPPSPEDLFSSEIVIAEWISLDLAVGKTPSKVVSEQEFTTTTPLQLFCRSK